MYSSVFPTFIIQNIFFLIPRNPLLWRRLTPWSRVLPEKLTGPQLVKKFPTFYGNRRFISAFTSARQLSLSWVRTIWFVPPHPTSRISILKLSSHLFHRSSKWSFPPGHPTKTLYALLFPLLATCPTHLILLDSISQIMYENFSKPQNKDIEGHGDYSQYWQLPENISRVILRIFFCDIWRFLCTCFTICRKTVTMLCGILLRIVMFLVIYSIFSLLFLVSYIRTVSWMPLRIRLAFHARAISGD